MPREAALVDLALSQGSFAAAREAAGRFIAAALESEERTWRGLAWECGARAAVAEGDHDRASRCIDEALSVIEGHELPLASWRVHATAAELFNTPAKRDRTCEYHLERSHGIIVKIANSLPSGATLRGKFLSSPRISRVYRELGKAVSQSGEAG